MGVIVINLNLQRTGPIYEQLREQLRKMLISGAIAENERLPSVRELAQSLAINPNTIQRAYRELEAEGYLYSIPGKGSFAGKRNSVNTKRRDDLLAEFESVAAELLFLGLESDELAKRLRTIANKDKGEGNT